MAAADDSEQKEMKILHVETGRHFYGGAQQVVYLLEGLGRQGVENVLVCPPDTEIDAQARRLGAKVYNVACAGDLDLGFTWWLRKIMRWEQPDLVHCHSRRGADFLGGMAAATAHLPAVVSRRVDNPEPEWVAKLRYRPFRKVIAISGNVADVLRENGVDEGRLTVIRSAVDFQRFQEPPARKELLQEFELTEANFVIASIGQLIPRKGHRYLLEAMANLSRKMPRARLIVFGKGNLASELLEQSARLGVDDIVHFAGFRDDLDRYMGAFDLVVHPALREGLGVSMLKAAAAGVAVVAFDVAGSREAVANGRTGILVRPKDTAALEQAILTLAENGMLRRSCGEAARKRMREEFSIEAMVEQHIELYRSLTNGQEAEQRGKGQPGAA
jgi:glycosyltransferase involved in cell wall biosynthesis